MIKVGLYSDDREYSQAAALALSENRENVSVWIAASPAELREEKFDVSIALDGYIPLSSLLKLYDSRLGKSGRAMPCSASCTLVAVTSAFGSAVQTSVSRALGRVLSGICGKRVLFLNLSGCTEAVQKADPEEILWPDEIIYGICCEGRSALEYREALAEDDSGLNELCCGAGAASLAPLQSQEAEVFVRAFAESGLFDCIILSVQYDSETFKVFACTAEETVVIRTSPRDSLSGILENRIREQLSREGQARARLHLFSLSDAGIEAVEADALVRGLDCGIFSDLGAALRPLAEDIASEMKTGEDDV